MKIFVINCGSSSLKYDLIDMNKSKTLLSGQFLSIGRKSLHKYTIGNKKTETDVELKNHHDAIEFLHQLLEKNEFVKNGKPVFEGIGHRVVHGGEKFVEATKIDTEVKAAIKELSSLAPLHNPVNLQGIELCEKYFPGLTQVAVFDTAFHQTLPKKAFLYGTPLDWYEKHKIRRFGFHGTSHNYVALKTADYFGQNINQLKLISCHLGNGASVCAVNYGSSVDTSMGFGPLEGLVMGTRSGDIDPTIIHYMQTEKGMDINDIMNTLNKKSGLLGISEFSRNMKEIEEKAASGDEKAILAIQIFVYRLIKTIGAYIAALGGVDGIIFTGGIGENSALIRERVCHNLEFAGAIIDEDVNNVSAGSDSKGLLDISAKHSRVKLLVVNTDEEWMIAHETRNIILGRSGTSPEQIPIPIGISARHIHLSKEDKESLFGDGYELTPIYDLSQPGQYVCDETLIIKGPKGKVERVRILGPERKKHRWRYHVPMSSSSALTPRSAPAVILKGHRGQH